MHIQAYVSLGLNVNFSFTNAEKSTLFAMLMRRCFSFQRLAIQEYLFMKRWKFPAAKRNIDISKHMFSEGYQKAIRKGFPAKFKFTLAKRPYDSLHAHFCCTSKPKGLFPADGAQALRCLIYMIVYKAEITEGGSKDPSATICREIKKEVVEADIVLKNEADFDSLRCKLPFMQKNTNLENLTTWRKTQMTVFLVSFFIFFLFCKYIDFLSLFFMIALNSIWYQTSTNLAFCFSMQHTDTMVWAGSQKKYGMPCIMLFSLMKTKLYLTKRFYGLPSPLPLFRRCLNLVYCLSRAKTNHRRQSCEGD